MTALRCARLGGPLRQPFADRLLQKRVEQREHSRVADLCLHPRAQRRVRDAVEVAVAVRVDAVGIPRAQQPRHPPQRVLGAARGTEAVALRSKRRVEDRFHNQTERSLDDAIPHRGNPERSPLLRALRNPVPTHRLRTVGAVAQRR